MPPKVILIDASPRRANDGVAESVRLAGVGGQFPYYYNGQHYRAGVVQLPTIVTAITFDGGDFGAGGVPQAAELQWAASRKTDLAAIANYFWIDAPITVRIGDENSVGTLPAVTITGKVLSATVDGGVVKLQLSDPAADLKKPLLTSRFGGTGGVDGPVEWDGRIKPRVWGRVWNLEGERIDPANNVYCFADPARPIQSFDALRDKGAPAAAINVLAWQGSVAATFAALQAAVAPQGGGVACPSIACVKWWTQPAGALTADLKGEIGAGYVETTAQIVQRLVQAGPNTPFAAGTIAAAQAARPAPVGWVAQDDSTGTASMIEELLGNSSLLWLLNASGEIVIREWAWGAGVASGVSQSVKRTSVIAPVGTRKLGFKRNETQMARGDLAAIVLVDGVTYSDGTPLTTVLTNVANTAAAADDKADQALAEIAAIGDPVDAISADLTNGSVQLFAYANGGVVSYAAATGEFKVYSGQTDISANFALSTQANPQALTMAYAGRTYSVTGGFDASEDTATVTIRATGSGAYAGVVLDKVLSLSKAKGGYEIVAALPSTNLFSGRVVFNEVDDKLYRYTGSAWTAAVPAADVSGQINYQQIGDGAVRVQHLLVQPNNLNPDPQFRDLGIWYQDDEGASAADGLLNAGGAAGGWYVEEDETPPDQFRGTRYLALWSGRPGTNVNSRYAVKTEPAKGACFRPAEGATYEIKASVKNDTNQWLGIGIEWINLSFTAVVSAEYMFIGAGESTIATRQIVAPAGASYGRIIFFNQGVAGGGAPLSGAMTITNISVRDTAGASMIVDGGILARHVGAGEITTDKLGVGAVTAAKIAVTQLSAISATIGLLRTATSGQRLEIENNQIRVYDGSNVLRVRMGIW